MYHFFGEFPRLSFKEFNKILSSNSQVPKRLLPPEFSLRSIRGKSFAHLMLKKLGKSNYKSVCLARIRKKPFFLILISYINFLEYFFYYD
ncbi:MAG: hypothetical protein PHY04_00110 [Candidatus ainarchaeum sp.]|nr:hypothetical protein [Candidatus ainarchaeum sp.]